MSAGERLRTIREERGMSAAELAERVGRSESAVRNQENGTNGIPATLAEKYGRVLGVDASFILYGAPRSGVSTADAQIQLLPVVGDVQAGAWLAVDEFDQTEPEVSTTVKDPRFPYARQWLRRVRGDSVNKLDIVEGDLVHLVNVEDAHYQVNTGDIVEVTRSRHQGADIEFSIKQVEITPNGILLWPRSTNARWNRPLELTAGLEAEDLSVSITGLVLSIIKPLKRFL